MNEFDMHKLQLQNNYADSIITDLTAFKKAKQKRREALMALMVKAMNELEGIVRNLPVAPLPSRDKRKAVGEKIVAAVDRLSSVREEYKPTPLEEDERSRDETARD